MTNQPTNVLPFPRATAAAPVKLHTKTAAVVLRAMLKTRFPGVKFSVRCEFYAGGSSINVRYTDGPAVHDVDAVVDLIEGKGFDGQTDCSYSRGGSFDFDGVTYAPAYCYASASRQISDGVAFMTKAESMLAAYWGDWSELSAHVRAERIEFLLRKCELRAGEIVIPAGKTLGELSLYPSAI